jgi:hypothetical protein
MKEVEIFQCLLTSKFYIISSGNFFLQTSISCELLALMPPIIKQLNYNS